jgi:hypothetical protein
MCSITTKRHRLPGDEMPDQSVRQKKACNENEKYEKPAAPTQSISNTPIPSGNSESQEVDVVSSALSAQDQMISPTQGPVHAIAFEKVRLSESADAQKSEKIHHANMKDTELDLTFPLQKDSPSNGDDTDTIPVSVKQEVVGTGSPTPFPTTHRSRKSLSTTVSFRSQDGKPKSICVPVPFSTTKEESVSSSTPTSNNLHQTSATHAIDLTDDLDQDTFHPISSPQINVGFIDEHGEEQHVTSFEECNTAEAMFEEACAWDIADKETKMLEIIIPGRKPARVRKNNEKHFAQKVFEPLKDVVSRSGHGQIVKVTVQKYM